MWNIRDFAQWICPKTQDNVPLIVAFLLPVLQKLVSFALRTSELPVALILISSLLKIKRFMKPMNIRKSLLCLCLLAGSLFALPCFSQCFSGSYTAEWQWGTNKKTNWLNLLRLDLNLPIKSGTDYIEAATLHMAKAKEGIGTDWQAFSNIEADNNVAAWPCWAIATPGRMPMSFSVCATSTKISSRRMPRRSSSTVRVASFQPSPPAIPLPIIPSLA